MKKGLMEIVFILDRSGSMSGLEKDTIGGFNSLIKKQRKELGKAVVSTVLFDDTCEVIHDRVPMEKVQAMTEDTYFVRGCTVLLDALGGATILATSTSMLVMRTGQRRPCSSSPPMAWKMPVGGTHIKKSSKWWSDRRTGMAGSSCS